MTPIAHGTTWRAAWVGIALATAAFCLWPLAANVGFFRCDELDLLDALQRGHPRWDWAWFARTDDLFYRPLGYALFTLQLAVTGGQPTDVHSLSIAHHALNTALAALLFARLGRPCWTALPLLFLPTAIGGIGWAAAGYERWLATELLLAALALRAGGRRALWAWPLFALALVTKETAVVFPLVAWLVVAHDRTARGVAVAITAAAVAFALWRVAYFPTSGPYASHWDASVPARALRYAAFAFSPSGSIDRVLGLRWLPGLVGALLLGGMALRRSPPAALGGAVAWLAPLLPVLALDKYDPHYTYLSSFALCWLLALAATGRARPVAGAPLLQALGITALFALPLAWHARLLADGFRAMGAAMLNLQEAHSRLPPAAEPIGVRIDPGAPDAAARLFTLHLEHSGRLPPLRVVTGAAEASLRLHSDGTVTTTGR